MKIKASHYINRLKKTHSIILTDAEKAFEKLQHPFLNKNSEEPGYRRELSLMGYLQKTYQWQKASVMVKG